MKNCCIIGGTGFIGRHLINKLLLSGRRITVIGRSASPELPLPEGVHYVANNLNDIDSLRKALADTEEIVDLAYATTPQTSFTNPVHDIVSNLPTSVQLFAVAAELPIHKFVWVSSGGTVYGNTEITPITEDFPTNPVSPYGITKLAIEKYARMYYETAGLPIVCVRPSNAYGEGQKPFRGQGFVATAMATILKQQPVTLYGDVGTIRDYIHISDLVCGIESTLDNGKPGQVYNIGTAIGKTNRDVLNVIRQCASATKHSIELQVLPARKFDVGTNILDYKKLKQHTGWEPKISFEQGIQKTWGWFLKQCHLKELT